MYDCFVISVVLSVENATQVLLAAGFDFDWVKGKSRLRLGIPDGESSEVEQHASTREEKIRTIVTYLLNVDPTPSWRRILSAVDQVGNDEAFAQKLYKYAEPLTGKNMLGNSPYAGCNS